MTKRRDRLPWGAGAAALVAGLLMLALKEPLAGFYGLPPPGGGAVASTNVACSALGLLRRRRAHPASLIGANLLWTSVCLALALRFAGEATIFGFLHLLGEGAFVATRAMLECRHCEEILAPAQASPEVSPGA